MRSRRKIFRLIEIDLVLLLFTNTAGYSREHGKQPGDRFYNDFHIRDSIRKVRFNEVDFIIDRIENTYVSGRRGMSDEEWNRRVGIVREKLSENYYPAKNYIFAWRYLGLLKQDAHFPFPDRGMLNREGFFAETDTIFPLWVQTWTDGTVYNVKDYTGKIPPHARIVSVNGHNAQNMALANRAMSPGEEANAMALMNAQYEADPLYWPNFSNYLFCENIGHPYEVVYANPGTNRIDTVILEGMQRSEKYRLFKKSGDKRRLKPERGGKRKPIVFNQIDNGTGVLEINQFWGKRWAAMLIFGKDWRFKRLLRKAMRKIERRDIRTLVIDISANPGGMTENIYYTLNYFTDKPIDIRQIYRVTESSRERIKTNFTKSAELSESDREYMVAYVDTLKEGTLFCTDTVRRLQYMPSRPKNRFTGKVYVLTGYQTYSAAQMFARYCRLLGIGKVAGQHAGGYNDITGNVDPIALPSLNWMRFEVPYCADGIYAEDDPYAYPTVDIPIELHFNDWIHRKDSTLTRLLNLIENEEKTLSTSPIY